MVEPSDLNESAQYCREHPGTTLKYIAPHLEYHVNNPKLEGALLYCLCTSKFLRHKEHVDIMSSAWLSPLLPTFALLSPGHPTAPPNFIYVPFDEDFQADVGAFIGKLWRMTRLPKPEAAPALQQMHDWIMQGI
jgi:hypothetical protein